MNTRQTYRAPSGLSMIEMMVTVALLTVIILGLVAMFNQTRKAFNSGLANVDWQDAGRVTMDMIARDIEQMAPASTNTFFTNGAGSGPFYNISAITNTNGVTVLSSRNFYVDYEPAFLSHFGLSAANGFNTSWPLPGIIAGTNDVVPITMQRLFFTTRYNQQWNAIGYKVEPNGAFGGVGVLYRYSATGPVAGTSAGSLQVDFINNPANLDYTNTAPTPPFSRVIDGVVDFRIQAFDLNGNPITPSNTNDVINLFPASGYTTNTAYWNQFISNAVPAYVEVELGILETPTLERFRSFSPLGFAPTPAALNYLTNHTGQVHFFRQRIRVPGVDPTAYHFP